MNPGVATICASGALIATLLAPAPAQACGGLFCDAGTQMPVDQNREDVLFVRDGETMEVHIRVLYSGDAESFAWVIPLMTAGTPSFEVGVDALFNRLDADSAPQFSIENIGGSNSCGGGSSDGSTTTGSGFVNADSANSGPSIDTQGAVGSFEFVVLSGGSAATIMQWLGDNGYDQDPDAEPLIAEYLEAGHKFAAVKLRASVGTTAIHPIVIRYPGDEPCVPLKLTSIAAQQDMAVRVYALDTQRMIPLNYAHVLPNYLRLDRFLSVNYDELITMAVDEAGGRGFVTEYVGDSEIVGTFGVYDNSWDASAFVALEPVLVSDMLLSMGLQGHPLLVPLLREFLPAPEGFDESDFWNNLDYYAASIDQDAWSGSGFAARIDEMIFAPGLHASMLLDTWPLLTRMYTTISPHEMTTDPIFAYRDDFPLVAREHQARRESACMVRGYWRIDEHSVCESDYDSWPDIAAGDGVPELPWARRVERLALAGAPYVMIDNDQAITDAVIAWNDVACVGWTPPGSEDGGATEGDSTEGDSTAGASDDSGGVDLATVQACGCTSNSGGPPLGALGLFALLGLRGRRRQVREVA